MLGRLSERKQARKENGEEGKFDAPASPLLIIFQPANLYFLAA
jgi:hypothetical protein